MNMQQSQSPEEILKAMAEGATSSLNLNKPAEKAIYTAPRMSNSFLRRFVQNLRKKGYDDKKVIEMVLNFDKDVERGSITQEYLENYKKN